MPTTPVAEAVKIEVQKAEILWAQKSNSSRPAGGRLAASYTICICSGEKGHYAKDCPKPQSKCNSCKRIGHVESVCRAKKVAAAQDPPPPLLSFFDGHSCFAKLQSETDPLPVFDFSSSDNVFGESMVGELEFFPKATSRDKGVAATSTTKEAAVTSTQHHFIMAANNIVTAWTDFLGDTGASHHIAHRPDYFLFLESSKSIKCKELSP